MRHVRGLFALMLLSVLAAAACSSSPTDPGQEDPADPVRDVIQSVTVRFDSLTVTGSCDHNSAFESPGDGEFIMAVAVRLGTSTAPIGTTDYYHRSLDGTYAEGVHSLGSNVRVTFARNITRGERFSVVFAASERDGLLGNDPALNNRSAQLIHEWRDNAWSGGPRMIALASSNPDLCGVRIRYTITSSVAS